MGTDIYAHIDYDFIDKDGNAYFTSCFADRLDIRRNSKLFALMAGIKAYNFPNIKPLFETRGIPKNRTHESEVLMNYGERRFVSYLYAFELEQVQNALEAIEEGYRHNQLDGIICMMKHLNTDSPYQSRLVFGFD